MNPFTWPGPQFLLFYLLLTLAAILVVRVRWMGNGRDRARLSSPTSLTGDPYGIAYLRGDREEAIKIAIFNLVDRHILSFSNGLVRQSKSGAAQQMKRPLDKAIVLACASPTTIKSLVKSASIRKEADAYEAILARQGYVINEEELSAGLRFGLGIAAVLLGVAAIKVVYALSHGRTNVGFLIVGAVLASFAVIAFSSVDRTRYGKRALSSLRTLMARAKANTSRLKAGGETNEALLLASVFGVHVLPDENFPVAAQMYPRPSGSDSSGGGDSGSSSSCSSGCGGGGGCGGCGG